MQHIYISYASEDKAYGERLKRVLKPSAGELGFTVWSMQDVSPGKNWQQEMASHLRDASLFLPLLSADHLASDRCQAEMVAARRLGRRLAIVCVLIRPVSLGSSLDGMFVLPGSGKPVAAWSNKDKAWIEIQRSIVDVMRSL